MGSYADRVKGRRAAAAAHLRARGITTIEQLQRRIQTLEAENDAIRQASTPAILVPTRDGTLLEGREYLLEQKVSKLRQNEMVNVQAFMRELANGEWETVENRTEHDFFGMLQGVPYTVPGIRSYPANIKRLPSKLAAQFRKKSMYGEATAKYNKTMGALPDHMAEPEIEHTMSFDDFKSAVHYGPALYANNVGSGRRTKMF